MATIWYYKNGRFDGGIRTGLDINDDRVFQRFVPGSEPEDPALEWFVDIKCEGPTLPTDPDIARDWFLAHVPLFQQRLEEVADRLDVGIDELSLPFVKSWPDADQGVAVQVRCSAIRRLSGLEIAHRLRTVASELEADVRSLPPAELVAL
jgi:hypothetical protein